MAPPGATAAQEVLEPEVVEPLQATLVHMDSALRAEVDVAVATAKRFPRSIAQFHAEMEEYLRSDPELCERSYYSLPRDNKFIQGPSVRFGELVCFAWRNTMVGTRDLGRSADGKFVVVEAAGFDLERGRREAEQVARRITDKEGNVYGDDMVALTKRAAAAIARREIYLRLVPAAVYRRHFNLALSLVLGGGLTLEERIGLLTKRAAELGFTKPHLLSKVGKNKLKQLNDKDMLHLWGVLNAQEDGMLDLEDVRREGPAPQSAKEVVEAAERAAKQNQQPGEEPGEHTGQRPEEAEE